MADLRSLGDLVTDADGRRLLEARGVFCESAPFLDAVAPPADERLAALLGLEPSAHPVYFGHQLCCDYQRSVASKFRSARQLAGDSKVTPFLLPVDTDRCGASSASTTVAWGESTDAVAVRLAVTKVRSLEIRFAPVERARLEELIQALSTWLSRRDGSTGDAQTRVDRLAEALLRDEIRTLGQVNLELTSLLLREHIGFDPPCVLISECACQGLLSDSLRYVVEHIDDFVRVFNDAIESLVAAGIDPQVRPVGEDYLPLHYSCPRDGRRQRLRRDREGRDETAVATCQCGQEYRFRLRGGNGGRGSLDELLASGRWSTDVTFPIYVNDLVSGVIAGRSSALYGLVLNEVLRQVLARDPVPMLLPEELVSPPPDSANGDSANGDSANGGSANGGSAIDSLLYEYLTGR